MTSDGILLTREPLMLDRKEEMLAGWRLRFAFGSLDARTGAATWWRVESPSGISSREIMTSEVSVGG